MPTDDNGIHSDWHDLAEQASKETNPEKLVKIIAELCKAIDHQSAPQQAKPVNKKSDNHPADD